jgi:CheY-like chemotaxis protein
MSRIVLYIEDDADNIRLVERVLERLPDIEVRAARTGRDGLAAAAHTRPALILLDNHLPDSDGEGVLRRLAATPATAAIRVVIVSGDSSPVTADELRAAGAADFLVKPFDIDTLITVIGRHLA